MAKSSSDPCCSSRKTWRQQGQRRPRFRRRRSHFSIQALWNTWLHKLPFEDPTTVSPFWYELRQMAHSVETIPVMLECCCSAVSSSSAVICSVSVDFAVSISSGWLRQLTQPTETTVLLDSCWLLSLSAVAVWLTLHFLWSLSRWLCLSATWSSTALASIALVLVRDIIASVESREVSWHSMSPPSLSTVVVDSSLVSESLLSQCPLSISTTLYTSPSSSVAVDRCLSQRICTETDTEVGC